MNWRDAFIGLAILFASYAAVSDGPDTIDAAEVEQIERAAYLDGLREGARQVALKQKCGYREFLTKKEQK